MAKVKELPAGKFDGVKTEPLFEVVGSAAPTREKQKSPRSVAWGKCPGCTAPSTGLIRSGDHYQWRTHFYMTHGGVRVPCRTSGVRLDDAAAKTDLTCPCQRKKRIGTPSE